MHPKLLLSILFVLCFVGENYAQDKIYKKDGSVIEGTVKQVGDKVVTYKRADNPEGPDYTIARNKLKQIEYASGTNDWFDSKDETDRKQHSRYNKEGNGIKYKKNILCIVPLGAVADDQNSTLAVGISYERQIDKNGYLAFSLPLLISPEGISNDQNSAYSNYGSAGKIDNIFYAMPCLKIYPFGNKGRVKYAVGPSVYFSVGHQTVNNFTYDPNYNPIMTSESKDYFVSGVMITNSLNFNPTKSLYLGIDLSIGLK